MDIHSIYKPSEIEDKWYQYWMSNKHFRSSPDAREAYTVLIPPPNVTGVLHMGHMLNITIQDVLVRRARMLGYNACWVPGTDHASIATEAKVVKHLADKGISKSMIGRDDFLTHAWSWKEKYGGIILEQLKKLGASCDWDRTRFTMEPSLYEAVIDVFIDLYEKGLIYRGTKMVNWDPAGQTTLSDEEVVFKEVADQLYYIRYTGVDFDGELLVATARPETIAGDVAVCVHPQDLRYKEFIGKKVRVPLIGREVEIIADEYIDREFGTGVLKVTPAHDINDYNIGLRFNLPVIDTLNADGSISDEGQLFIGEDRFIARKKWILQLKHEGLLAKQENHIHNVGFSERTDAVIEPRISTQWFMDMKKFMKRNPEVLSSVLSDKVKFHPPKFKNAYRYWIENIKDWNISRQLWWGHRIPAWYNQQGDWVVAKTIDQAVQKFADKGIALQAKDLGQDSDVLDTWFSSWLWPISVFDGIGENANPKELDYYYPSNDLVTGPDIMFFWVARMIMAGYEYKRQAPFGNVYFTGIVRDKQRRKMSKSLGNSPEPLDLIQKFGADGVRMGMLLCSPAGNEILFDESQVEQGRNFCNKIWNAFRLIQGWTILEEPPNEASIQALAYFEIRLHTVLIENEKLFSEYRLSEALMSMYKLIWDDFCAIYLEAVKPPFGLGIERQTLEKTQSLLKILMGMLHPYMPFITEEIYQELHNETPVRALIVSDYPRPRIAHRQEQALEPMQLITEIRNLRSAKGLSPKETLKIHFPKDAFVFHKTGALIEKLANVAIQESANNLESGRFLVLLIGKFEVTIEIDHSIDKQKSELLKEQAYFMGFISSVSTKLGNEKFVQNANPAVVKIERKKMKDAQEKLQIIENQLNRLS